MSSSFSNQIVAITGGASGMGLATAKILAARGASISIADIDQNTLDTAAAFFQKASAPCLTTKVNVTKSQEVDEWISATVKHFGKLDLAVNCAGIAAPSSPTVVDCSDEEWHMVLDVNLSGVFYAVRAELRAMRDNGAIVNIASIAGLKSFPTQVAYTASKHGVIGITRTAAKEVGHRGIRVNAVCPGYVETPMTAAAEASASEQMMQSIRGFKDLTALKRHGQPEEIAGLIVYLLSNDASYVTGSVQVADGGNLA